jgi:hypothetical protein
VRRGSGKIYLTPPAPLCALRLAFHPRLKPQLGSAYTRSRSGTVHTMCATVSTAVLQHMRAARQSLGVSSQGFAPFSNWMCCQ